MVVYGNLVLKDSPYEVVVTSKVDGSRTMEINEDYGVIITPGQDILQVQIVRSPDDPEGLPSYKKPMRFLRVIPWEGVSSLEFKYSGPPAPETYREDERKALREAMESLEGEEDDPEA